MIRVTTTNIIEMIIGAILLGLGLLYLSAQSRTVDRLIGIANEDVLAEGDLYQQFNNVDISQVSYEELVSIVIGYRDYPIVIDGHVIPTDGNDYDYYFTLISGGYYTKSYVFDAGHNLVQIIYTNSGA